MAVISPAGYGCGSAIGADRCGEPATDGIKPSQVHQPRSALRSDLVLKLRTSSIIFSPNRVCCACDGAHHDAPRRTASRHTPSSAISTDRCPPQGLAHPPSVKGQHRR